MHKTEKELRASKAPTPENLAELSAYIHGLAERPHDYGTCVYAMSLSAMAAFNYVASKLGVTGFQASCADMDFFSRSRGIKGGFMVIELGDALYPQTSPVEKAEKYVRENRAWLRTEARKKMAERSEAHPDVFHHWMSLAVFAPVTLEDIKQWDALNPDDQIGSIKNTTWYDRNRADVDVFCRKLAFLRDFQKDGRNPDFIRARAAECIEHGINRVSLFSEADIALAETCEEGSTYRLDMPTCLRFSANIGGVKVEWDVEAEKDGSEGMGKLQFDWDKLESMATAAPESCRQVVLDYIAKARAHILGLSKELEPA